MGHTPTKKQHEKSGPGQLRGADLSFLEGALRWTLKLVLRARRGQGFPVQGQSVTSQLSDETQNNLLPSTMPQQMAALRSSSVVFLQPVPSPV